MINILRLFKKSPLKEIRKALQLNGFELKQNGDMHRWETNCLFDAESLNKYKTADEFYEDYPFYHPKNHNP